MTAEHRVVKFQEISLNKGTMANWLWRERLRKWRFLRQGHNDTVIVCSHCWHWQDKTVSSCPCCQCEQAISLCVVRKV